MYNNTFHFAGVSSKSTVTRGVQRIEEILSLSENPKNPSLTIYLKKEDEHDNQKANMLMHTIEHTNIQDIVSSIEIYRTELIQSMADALSINIALISIVLTQSGSNVVVKYIIIGSYQMTITVVERLQTNIMAVDGLNQLFTFETSKKIIKKKSKK